MVIREDTRRMGTKLVTFEEKEINFILDKKEKMNRLPLICCMRFS